MLACFRVKGAKNANGFCDESAGRDFEDFVEDVEDEDEDAEDGRVEVEKGSARECICRESSEIDTRDRQAGVGFNNKVVFEGKL